MNKPIDLTIKHFDHFIVLGIDANNKHINRKWICKCECGNIFSATTSSLNSHGTVSCGCYASQISKNLYVYGNKAMEQFHIQNTNVKILDRKKPTTNTSGTKGVYYRTERNCWCALITVNGKSHRRNCKSKKEAIIVRDELYKLYAEPIISEFYEMVGD